VTAGTARTRMTVPQSAIQRATRLAEALTSDPEVTGDGDGPWTAQDVLSVALLRGLEVMELQHLGEQAKP
jgi:hypothetical protein